MVSLRVGQRFECDCGGGYISEILLDEFDEVYCLIIALDNGKWLSYPCSVDDLQPITYH